MAMLIEQLKVEIKVYLRQPLYLLFSLLMPVFSFLFFGMMYGNVDYNGFSFFANYIPGFSVIILFASSVYNVGNQVVGDKEKGIYKRLSATPISLGRIMGVVVFKGFLLALLGFVIILLLAVFRFNVTLPNPVIYCVSYVVTIVYSLAIKRQQLPENLFSPKRRPTGTCIERDIKSRLHSNIFQCLQIIPRTATFVLDLHSDHRTAIFPQKSVNLSKNSIIKLRTIFKESGSTGTYLILRILPGFLMYP